MKLRWVAISSVNKTGGMRRLRRSSSSPMELTVELMGSKPINPRVLAEREGFESACKRKFNNMQGYGWHESMW